MAPLSLSAPACVPYSQPYLWMVIWITTGAIFTRHNMITSLCWTPGSVRIPALASTTAIRQPEGSALFRLFKMQKAVAQQAAAPIKIQESNQYPVEVGQGAILLMRTG